MTDVTVERTPPMKAVAMEQLRVVGLAVRREALLLCIGLTLFVFALPFMEDGSPTLIVDPVDLGYLAVIAALVAPLGVWKGEKLFGESLLWTAPVEHARHARLKIASGWVWLMAVVAFGYLAIVLAIVSAGGSIGVEEIRLIVANPAAERPGIAGPLPGVPWSTQLWQWTIPFTTATAVYLAASAFLIGFRRPVAWAVGCWLFILAIGLLVDNRAAPWLVDAFEEVGYWLDLLVTGGSGSAQRSIVLESGARVRAWTRLPTLGSWAAATTIWLGLTGAAMWAASGRHRET